MRSLLASIGMLVAFAATAGSASAYVGAPLTHGPDTSAVASGELAPAPDGGPTGGTAKPGVQLSAKAVAEKLPTTWCGPERTTDDTTSETDNGGYKEHAVYMIPADGVDRFAQAATGIQTSAMQASALLETDYGRAIRFDMGTSCGPQYLDITVVRMPQTTAQLRADAQSATGTFDDVSAALDAAGLPTIHASDTYQQAAQRTRNWIVWLDGPAPANTCGQASIYDDPARDDGNLNNFGGKVAVVFPSGDGGFCSSNAVRHEIGHNLGALQPEAPHAFDGSHCDDAIEDTMCYTNSPQVTASGARGQFFDYNNDDYWDPPHGAPLPWWTVDLNRFLCPDAGCNVAPGPSNSPGAPAQAPAPPADSDGDGVPDSTDNCPNTPNADQLNTYGDARGDACEQRPVHSKLRMKVRRHGSRWKLKLRATGSGVGVVTVRCRTHRRGQVRTVYHRRADLPATLRKTVRCRAGRPKARLLVG